MQRIWDRVHGGARASEQPEPEVLAFVEHVGPQLLAAAPVLDAGCGQGRHTLLLARLGLAACGCDVSAVAVSAARERLRQGGATACLQVADVGHLPYRDAAFGAALCVHVLPYHCRADLAQAVGELRRVVRPEGYLCLDLLACEDAEYGCGPELEEHTFLDPDGVPIHFTSIDEVHRLLQGLTVESIARLERGSPAHRRVSWAIRARRR